MTTMMETMLEEMMMTSKEWQETVLKHKLFAVFKHTSCKFGFVLGNCRGGVRNEGITMC